MKADKLTDKQKRFCQEYLKDCNAAQAAVRAGYSAKTAKEQAARLLTNVNLQEYLNSLMNKVEEKCGHSVQEATDYLFKVLNDEVTEETLRFDRNGHQVTTLTKPKVSDKIKAADLLLKKFGEYNQTVDVNLQSIEFVERDSKE